jgi:tetratricopeptide (TPR) repeat protein
MRACGALIIALALATAAAGTVALGDPLGDAAAGYDALSRGDSHEAVRLLTKAIDSGALSVHDLEIAYVTRGRAYLAQNGPDHARRDADRAIRLTPTDPDGVSLWQQTTIEVQPAGNETFSSDTETYLCQNPRNPNARSTEFVVDATKGWIMSPTFGESGRKLDVEIQGAQIIWHEVSVHPNGGDTVGIFEMIIDRRTGVWTDHFHWTNGVDGQTTFACHLGQSG